MLWIGLSLVVLIIILTIAALSLISMIEQMQYWNTTDKIMFLPSFNRNIRQGLTQLIDSQNIQTENWNLVELGCGRAGIIRFLNGQYTWKSVNGVEGQFVIWLQAKILALGKNINLIRGDLFQTKISKPSLIYCYLSKPILKKLLENGKFKNCLVISLDYPIKSATPTSSVDIKSNKNIQNKLLLYDFR